MEEPHYSRKRAMHQQQIGKSKANEPKKKRQRKRWKKPKDKPKRPLSAYNLFFAQERIAIKRSLEESSDVSTPKPPILTFTGMAKHVGAKWKALDSALRKPFEEGARLAKLQYASDVAAWKGKHDTMPGQSSIQPEFDNSDSLSNLDTISSRDELDDVFYSSPDDNFINKKAWKQDTRQHESDDDRKLPVRLDLPTPPKERTVALTDPIQPIVDSQILDPAGRPSMITNQQQDPRGDWHGCVHSNRFNDIVSKIQPYNSGAAAASYKHLRGQLDNDCRALLSLFKAPGTALPSSSFPAHYTSGHTHVHK